MLYDLYKNKTAAYSLARGFVKLNLLIPWIDLNNFIPIIAIP